MLRMVMPIALVIALLVAGSGHEGEAHLRFGYFAAGAANVDVFVNGEPLLTDFEAHGLSDFIGVELGRRALPSPARAKGQIKHFHEFRLSAAGWLADLVHR